MGLIGRVLSFVRATRGTANVTDVKTDPGGGPNVTPEHFGSPGDDSHPLPGDYVYASHTPQTGKYAAVGYVDPKNEQKASGGEKRIYARDANGDMIVELWLKADGEAVLVNDNGSVTLGADGAILGQNAVGSFQLEVGGDFVVNGVTIAANGDVTIPSSLTLNGKEIAEHTHPINSGSSAPGPTGPNN